MNDSKIDEGTLEACNIIKEHGYFPSINDKKRIEQGKLPFLTPVFFDIKVLDRYQRDSDYYINWYTETTGSIGQYNEWSIEFGINENNNVQIWLGDFENLSDKEKARFIADEIADKEPSFNFIRAQLMVSPANIPKLTEISIIRESINMKFYKKYNNPLFLDKENSQSLFSDICKPIMNTRDELAISLTKINKVFTESINIKEIKAIINDKDECKNKGTIKIFEMFLNKVTNEKETDDIIRSFYILDDFRIVSTHVAGNEKFEFCLERLDIKKDSSDYITIYNKMLDSLLFSLDKLDRLFYKF